MVSDRRVAKFVHLGLLIGGALSFVLAAALIALWVRAAALESSEQFSAAILRERYTVRCEPHRLTLYKPPPAEPRDVAEAYRLLLALPPDGFQWHVQLFFQDGKWKVFGSRLGIFPSVVAEKTRTYQALGGLPGRAVDAAALRVMEDSARVVVTHEYLAFCRRGTSFASFEFNGWYLDANYDGLRFELYPTFPSAVPNMPRAKLPASTTRYVYPPIDMVCRGHNVSVDPKQLPQIRRMWHDRLDVELGSVGYVWPILALMVLPGVSLRCWWLARSARRRGSCPVCRYDLRATPGLCPECGYQAS